MKEAQKMNKKLKTSAVLFLIAFIGIGISIIFLVLNIVGILPRLAIMIFGILFAVGYILFLVSGFINLSYRRGSTVPGKLSTFMFVVMCVLLFPIMIFLFVALLIGAGNNIPFTGSSGLKQVTITDGEGKVYNLTQTYIGSNEYKDQYGDRWKTYDGVNFERVDIKATDDKGNETTLTPAYNGIITKHYQDQDGEEWKSEDGGQTFEHVVTQATVTDKDGNEYSLRAVQAGLDNFIDQNGDMWTTYDGGKTFERR